MKAQQIITPVILSGGSGKRLWPLSRRQHPKQYLPLISKYTMLQETILRLQGLKNISEPIIVCNKDHRFLVAEQCKEIGIKHPIILLEPVGRNTAPAITAAALYAAKKTGNSMLLVLSSDHVIQDVDSFYDAINIAIGQANLGNLVVFGITPTSANIGYGYIQLSSKKYNNPYKVEGFVEKPNLEMAQSYIDHGGYLWNSGMFVFQVEKLIKELSTYVPDMVSAVKVAVDCAVSDLDFIRLDEESFSLSLDISIDYALMEKSHNVAVVPLDAGWSDIGSWPALYDAGIKDANNNVIHGEVYTKKTVDTYISSSKGHLLVVNGLKNLIVVNTPDVTFVSNREDSTDLSSIIDKLNKKNKTKIDNNRKVYRPWGWYDSIDSGKNFQVKRIHVNPGGKLSLQSHTKRAEHWIVIKGNAHTLIDGKMKILGENQSIYVPTQCQHSLENKDNKNYLELIEVQSGTYFGEDDIVRYEDVYGRMK